MLATEVLTVVGLVVTEAPVRPVANELGYEPTVTPQSISAVCVPLSPVSLKAVSYTHLDVYKRQVFIPPAKTASVLLQLPASVAKFIAETSEYNSQG